MVASACLILSLAASSFLLHRIDRLRPQGAADDALFLSSPKVIQRASLGYDGLMACIYWTRAVQYFGFRHHYFATSYNQLAPLLEITTHLDPHLMVAYVYYMELHDYKKAAETFERGSHVPNAHPFLKVMAAQMAQHAGEYETARMLWSATYQTAQDAQIKENATEHLRALRVDEDVEHLQKAVTRFGERTGRLPASIAELASAEGLSGTPVDPDGHAYKLTPEGRVEIRVPDDFPFASKGLPPGYKPAPKYHQLQ
jgi:hypothetical protein